MNPKDEKERERALGGSWPAEDFAARAVPGLIVDQCGGDFILLHPSAPRWALANPMGLYLARRLNGSAALLAIAREIAENYGHPSPDMVLKDIRSFVRQLLESGLLANAPDGALARESARALGGESRSNPPSLTIYPTEECNLRCKHCAIVMGRAPEAALSPGDIRRLIEEHASRFENPIIAFLGGEPLLYPGILDLLEFAARQTEGRRGRVRISTNGLLVDDEMARRLAALPIRIQVSLEGPSAEIHEALRGAGTFAPARAAIDRLIRHGAGDRLVIASVLSRALLPHLQRMIEFVDGLGVREHRLLVLNRIKTAKRNWDIVAPDAEDLKKAIWFLLYEWPDQGGSGGSGGSKTRLRVSFPGFVPNAFEQADAWCPLGRTFIVDSQGKVFNCPMLGDAEFALGDIHSSSLEAIAEGAENAARRQAMLNRPREIEDCRRCAWRNFCQGSCQAFSYFMTGDFARTDEFCEFRRELYREYVRRQARR